MTTPDVIASSLVDGPNPADRTLPLIDRDAADGRDFLTLSRRAYRELVEAAVREALAERDAEVGRLTAERDHHERQQRALLYGDLPKLRAERDEFFRQRCDLLHERDQLAAERDALRRQNADLKAVVDSHAATLVRLQAENAALRDQVTGHCERIAKQSDLLSRRAERTWADKHGTYAEPDVDAAVKVEREACAELAFDMQRQDGRGDIGNAILARTAPPV